VSELTKANDLLDGFLELRSALIYFFQASQSNRIAALKL
jgi:hypothetical protein